MRPELDDVTVVVPTIGRSSLPLLLSSLAEQTHLPHRVVLVDDRAKRVRPLGASVPAALAGRTVTVGSGGRGPAAARNVGWRASSTPWIVFLDDDVVVTPGWSQRLRADVIVGGNVAASQGRLHVPLPADRRPTDRERNVARLGAAAWITADLAVRAAALDDVAGFDERFPRAYREDSDLALRLQAHGWQLCRGTRLSLHPVQPAPWWTSVTAQRGNRDDALMEALHGRHWRREPGRRRRHLAVTGALAAAVALGLGGHRRSAATAAMLWLAGTVELAAARIAPGPRRPREVVSMAVTSALIPPAAAAYWVSGWLAWSARRPRPWDVSAVA